MQGMQNTPKFFYQYTRPGGPISNILRILGSVNPHIHDRVVFTHLAPSVPPQDNQKLPPP